MILNYKHNKTDMVNALLTIEKENGNMKEWTEKITKRQKLSTK